LLTRAVDTVTRVRIDIGGGLRLFVDIDGPGLVPDGATMVERPTVLLLHGGPGSDHSWYKSSPVELTDLAQVVYYDHRGNGRSDPGSSADWTLDVWADDVVRLCDALGIDHPIVIGESFGGMVAQRYLARHSGHPARVVLASTAPRFDLDSSPQPSTVSVARRLQMPLASSGRKALRRSSTTSCTACRCTAWSLATTRRWAGWS
jgi:pimeloyl-ACP methyl ester carboxylesterase